MRLLFVLLRNLALTPKRIQFHPNTPIIHAASILARAVKLTLGPAGANVLIENDANGNPSATKDGVTVAKNVMLQDPQAEQCAYLIRNSANQANKESGDGTTTTTIVTAQLVVAGLRALQSGVSIRSLKSGFDLFETESQEFLKLKALPITKPLQYSQVANIASNGDREVNALVVGACIRSSFSQTVKVEEAKGPQCQLVVDNYISIVRTPEPRFYEEKELLSMNFPMVLLMREQLTDMREMAEILGQVKTMRKSILIFAPNFNKEVLNTLYFNHSRGIIKVCPISLQGDDVFIQEQLQDLSVVFRTKVYTQADLAQILPDELGTAKEVLADKFQTKIYAPSGDNSTLLGHIENLEKQPSTAFLKERIQRLKSNRITIMVGAQNQLHFKEKRDKVIDTLNALLSAKRKGVLPGGGVALLRLTQLLPLLEFDDDRVRNVLHCALEAPFRQLCNDRVTLSKQNSVRKGEFGEGVDVREGEICNMIERGIVDGCEAVVQNLRTSLRAAYLLLTTKVIITNKKRTALPSYREFKGKYGI